MEKVKETGLTEAIGYIIDGGQEAKTEILAFRQEPYALMSASYGSVRGVLSDWYPYRDLFN